MANPIAVLGEDSVASELGLTEQSIERRRRMVGLGADDLPRIARVRELVTRHAEEYASAFFSHLAALEGSRDLMQNRDMSDWARRLKIEHIGAMAGGQYGIEYARERVKLGLIYSRMNVPFATFIGAFHELLRTLAAGLIKSARNPDEALGDYMALEKVAFLDIGLIVDVMALLRERTIGRQQEAIRELSTPVLQLREQLLMLPIIGMIDTHRARLLTEGLLHAIRAHRAKVVVLDVTGVGAMDTKVANHLLHTVSASKLMGATVIVTGLSAEVAQTLVNLGVDLTRLSTIGDLRDGIEEAERMLGYQITRTGPRASFVAGTV